MRRFVQMNLSYRVYPKSWESWENTIWFQLALRNLKLTDVQLNPMMVLISRSESFLPREREGSGSAAH